MGLDPFPSRSTGSRHGRWLVVSLVLLSAALLAPEARGATRYVSKKGVDASNSCLAPAAPCLTVAHAVAVAVGGDTISIGTGKFVEPNGVTVNKDLTIVGAGNFLTRVGYTLVQGSVFGVLGGVVTIADLDVMYGKGGDGGGGIMNLGDLTLDRVRLWKNEAIYGGGIWNGGTLRVSQSEIAHNTGGGLFNLGGYVELNEVRISANDLGIMNRPGGDLVVTQSLVNDNVTVGISNEAATMQLTNTTVARNGQTGISTEDRGTSTLFHVTVAENGKGPRRGGFTRGGLRIGGGSDVQLISTIVANNTPEQCQLDPGNFLAADTRYSLISDSSCLPPPSPDILLNVDPQLGPLKYNGGFSRTYALKSGSPAIDAVPDDDAWCHLVDQRGVLRPIAENCDMGAFEYSPLKRGWPTEVFP